MRRVAPFGRRGFLPGEALGPALQQIRLPAAVLRQLRDRNAARGNGIGIVGIAESQLIPQAGQRLLITGGRGRLRPARLFGRRLRRRRLLAAQLQFQPLLRYHAAKPIPVASRVFRKKGFGLPRPVGQFLQAVLHMRAGGCQIQLFPGAGQRHIQNPHLLHNHRLLILQLHGSQRQRLVLKHGVIIPQLTGKAQFPVHGDIAVFPLPGAAEAIIAAHQEHDREFQALGTVYRRYGDGVAAGYCGAFQLALPAGQPPQIIGKVAVGAAAAFVIRRMGLQQPQIGHRPFSLRQDPAFFPKIRFFAQFPDQLRNGKLLHPAAQKIVILQKSRIPGSTPLSFRQQVLVKPFPAAGQPQPGQIVAGKAVHRRAKHLGQFQIQHRIGEHRQIGNDRFDLSGFQKTFPLSTPDRDPLFPQRIYIVLRPVFGRAHQDTDIPRTHRTMSTLLLHGTALPQQRGDLPGDLRRFDPAAVGSRRPCGRRQRQNSNGARHRVIERQGGNQLVLRQVVHSGSPTGHDRGKQPVDKAGDLPPGTEIGRKGDAGGEMLPIVQRVGIFFA